MQVLNHCPAHWLSLLCIVQHVFSQYPALVAYFTSLGDLMKVGKVKRAMERLNDSLTKPNLLLLSFTLPSRQMKWVLVTCFPT